MSLEIAPILHQAHPIIPVLTLQHVEDAVPLAEALQAGGIDVVEVTLRTDQALAVIKAMKQVKGMVVGAGTVVRASQFRDLEEVKADFAVSPGATPQLLETGRVSSMPFLPAAATVSEVLQGMEAGFDCFKFFPASVLGGAPALKAFHGPLPDITFCPTGGISLANCGDYLSLPNVACVGGSWIVPGDALQNKDWSRIEQLAREVATLG
ncbi:MAG: bifunctional 4-hydroxy-2-oxoglutarate aldolase/2-dehydro-3-deoxy-phosphogluconate aldolase [Natronospirillum sp.]|uniref:bifunctional 4-hydroxy-2-oxoglutarate aldolase/2-dehydro-3-deoxy-phosphogluconate aldolase n=1 Tax=Natronospirillum sp. TaxID=2812955 RepID=UPI0025D3169C|nr:bifunctional 4-hydroxy-2-oxoglutarate aldolase/2-dehydro-3-deoxy-phosphogluconate aldolase [Natronospirillum sp.]MCH8552525.1 bifunctional 4-hydroxy-2-oxoglutarate aldolase/2-dehydro-3-deoxy-phosphogluconate aldolase [Natronospirillum sp.]